MEGATAGVFPNGLQLPLVVVAVQLGHDQAGKTAAFQRQIEAGDLAAVGAGILAVVATLAVAAAIALGLYVMING